ncbi:MAG: hypothetical protein J6A59_18035 [Lachnospiraceae bacterium]|nr:hypothetical protein [Lachnospiraceae bacterium]
MLEVFLLQENVCSYEDWSVVEMFKQDNHNSTNLELFIGLQKQRGTKHIMENM